MPRKCASRDIDRGCAHRGIRSSAARQSMTVRADDRRLTTLLARGGRRSLPSAPLMSVMADDVGAGNYDDIRGCHYPKGVFADYWDMDEHPHNGTHSQQEG